MSYRQLNDGLIQTMRELRANNWSFEGIARIYSAYGVTANTVEFLTREGAVDAVVDRAAELVMSDLAREASDAIERMVTPCAPRCRCYPVPIGLDLVKGDLVEIKQGGFADTFRVTDIRPSGEGSVTYALETAEDHG